MGKYSIKDLERLSGIKAHTIRIWEQRYKIIEPDRTDTNIRFYSDEDLKKILNIALLNKKGIKISSIAQLSAKEIGEKVLMLADNESDVNNQINVLTIAMVEMDEERFEKIISTNTLRFGFEKTMIQILYPFLHRIGIMWQTGAINPAQEHFISNLIRQKLIVAIDGQQNATSNSSPSFVLFCPEGELHEIPLLFVNYLLKTRNFRVIYLGISVPLRDLTAIVKTKNPDFIFTSVTTKPQGFETQKYISKLSELFKKHKLIVTGQEMRKDNLKFPKNINCIRSIEEVIKFFNINKN
jgi:DNA-binding transcriptional MerR regulator